MTGFRTNAVTTFLGSLAGIAGTLQKDSSGVWTFTRTTSGAATATADFETFSCDANVGTENDIQSIWMGRNDVGSTTLKSSTLACTAAMIGYMKPLLKRYVVISITNGTNEKSGTTLYNAIIDTNNALKAVYGDRYYDLRSDFIQNGLSVAGITPTADDLTSIAEDRPPPSLMSDTIHPNAAGYSAQKILFANWLQNQGYFI